jgi:hypothetical protein
MRWTAALAAVGLLLAVAVSAGDAAKRRAGVESAGCRHQSLAGFPHAYRNPDNVVVGPLAFVGALRNGDDSPQSVEHIGGIKSPAVLRPGHTARVSISPGSRSNVRLQYGPGERRDDAVFASLPHTVRFTSCSRRRAGSRVDGRRVTFWSGFYAIRDAPTCIGVDISIDGRRAHHRVIPVAQASCP